MAASIFGHLEFEQGKLLETRTIHNDDRVSAPERRGFFWTFISLPDRHASKLSKNDWNRKGKEAFAHMTEDTEKRGLFLTDCPQQIV